MWLLASINPDTLVSRKVVSETVYTQLEIKSMGPYCLKLKPAIHF